MKSVFFTENTELLKDANILFRSAEKQKKSATFMGKQVNKYVYHYKVRYINENGEEVEKRFLTAKQIQQEFSIGKTTLYNYKNNVYNYRRKNDRIKSIVKLDPPEKVNITVLFFD